MQKFSILNICTHNTWCVLRKNLAANSIADASQWKSYNTQRKESPMNVFSRKAKRLHRDRMTELPDYKIYDYVKNEMGYRLADRICDVKRKFDIAVDLGCGRGHVSKHIYQDMVGTLMQCELSEKLLRQADNSPEVSTDLLVVDEEYLPFKPNSIDLFVSSLSLHWVNDLPGCFRQVHRSLRNDGVFIGSMFGGDTLFELRSSLIQAEQKLEGGIGAHVSPFIDIKDLGGLLQGSKFTMPTIDVDEMVIKYPSVYELMHDLKGMGENNCSWNRKAVLRPDTVKEAAAIYKEMYGDEEGVPATYQVFSFIGWKPDPSQPKPAERGSGQISLEDIGSLDDIIKKINIEDFDNKK